MKLKQVKHVKSPPFFSLAKVAFEWRKSKGGPLPNTLEEIVRNIKCYCNTVAHLN